MSAWSGFGNFATLNGAAIVNLLDKTGFKSYKDFMSNTTPYQRELLFESFRAYQAKLEAEVGR